MTLGATFTLGRLVFGLTPAAGFADPVPGFVDPAAGFVDPAAGFVDPVLGFVDPAAGLAALVVIFAGTAVGFAEPVAVFAEPTAGFVDLSVGFSPAKAAGNMPAESPMAALRKIMLLRKWVLPLVAFSEHDFAND